MDRELATWLTLMTGFLLFKKNKTISLPAVKGVLSHTIMLALRQCWIVGAATFGLIPRTLLKCDATGASSSWCLFHKSASRIDLSLLSEENVSKCMFVSIIKTQGLANSIIFLIYIYIFSGLLGFCLDSKPLWMMERDCFYFFSFFFLLHKGCLPQLMCYIILEMCFGIIRSCWPLLLSPCVSVRVFHPAQILEEMRALLKEPPQGPSTRVVSLIAS